MLRNTLDFDSARELLAEIDALKEELAEAKADLSEQIQIYERMKAFYQSKCNTLLDCVQGGTEV